jgi:trehalose/maltose transport system substrate-binding protein
LKADIDVYRIDVTWPGIAAHHAIDLKRFFKSEELNEFFPRIIENNTVNGQLIGVPLFTDVGLLYYRTDLLKKYGYNQPPATWQVLTTMAQRIQEGERAAGRPDFFGFLWQGAAYEGLTCDALEWIYSFGGGRIIEPDGQVSVNNLNAVKAIETAKAWVGVISPRGVTTYMEEEARNNWQSGNAAFMRNWPYAYSLGQDPKSPISGKFSVTILPKGDITGGHSAATLGGWQLMVSKYSKNPEAAADLVRYLTSEELQKRSAIELSTLPTRPKLYHDSDVLAANPWFANVLEVLNNAVARPSTILRIDYNQFSTTFFNNINQVLNNQKSASEAMKTIEDSARRFLPAKK